MSTEAQYFKDINIHENTKADEGFDGYSTINH